MITDGGNIIPFAGNAAVNVNKVSGLLSVIALSTRASAGARVEITAGALTEIKTRVRVKLYRYGALFAVNTVYTPRYTMR